MTILRVLIFNLILPAALSSTVIALGRRLARASPAGRPGRWGVAVGLGVGYLAGHVGIVGWPGFPAIEAIQWVPWLVLIAVIVGGVEASWSVPGAATWTLRGLFVALALGLLLRSKVENSWTPMESVIWIGILWMVLLSSWWNLEAQAERLSGPGWVVPLGLISAGWAATLLLSGGAALGQLAGVLAATLLGALPTTGLRTGPALSKGGPAIALSVMAGLGLIGYFYNEVPALAASILAIAPWLPWVDRIGFIRRRSYWTRASIRFLAVILAVGCAIFVAEAANSNRFEDGSGP